MDRECLGEEISKIGTGGNLDDNELALSDAIPQSVGAEVDGLGLGGLS
jgi:hypothetical protein